MKNIFLIGDSIRFGTGLFGEHNEELGYGYHVEKALEGKAKVYQANDNCRFLQYTLRHLHDWAAELEIGENIDIVHWNNGLWDVLRLFGDDIFTPIDQYKILLVRVYKRIKYLFPNARVIFALNTPVIEEWSDENFTRKNSEIDEYNKAAIEVLEPLGVEINDLNTVAKPLQPKFSHDWVHYNEEGAKILADAVVKKLGF